VTRHGTIVTSGFINEVYFTTYTFMAYLSTQCVQVSLFYLGMKSILLTAARSAIAALARRLTPVFSFDRRELR